MTETPDRPFYLTAPRLITAAGLVHEDAAVLVQGGRIAAVGRADEVPSPPAARRLDFPDGTILPGLIDLHGHLRLNHLEPEPRRQVQDEPTSYLLHAVANLRASLLAGVTTMRTCGDRDYLDVRLRDALAAGLVEGPRLVVATRGIKHPDCPGGIVATWFCRSPDEARQAVGVNVAHGTDWIKFYATGGVFGPWEQADQACYGPAEIAALVQAARAHGRPVAVHCNGGPAARWCIEAGVATIEHGSTLSDADLALMAERGTRLVSTLGVLAHPASTARREAVERFGAAELERRATAVRDTLARAVRAGVRVVVGTDGLHGLPAFELAELVRAGLRPLDAIAAATREAAAVLGLADELGTVEPGKRADLLVVRGDPLEEIGALERVAAVIQDGQIHWPRR